MNISEYTKIFLAIWRSAASVQLSTKWTMNFPKRSRKLLWMKTKKLELVPPHDHQTNPAEKCINTFKYHSISGLSAMDPNFPLHLWCCIIPQCQDTLNMMHTSHLHPYMSSFTHMNGHFDYNATPMAPTGIRTLV